MTAMTPPPGTSPPAAGPPPRAPGAPDAGLNWGAFFNFRYMITPILVQIIYLLGAALITVFAIISLFTPTNSAIASIFLALVVFFFGNLIWRVYMELIMLLFRINGSVQEIERRGRGM